MHIPNVENKTPRKDFDWFGSHDQSLTITKPESRSHEKNWMIWNTCVWMEKETNSSKGGMEFVRLTTIGGISVSSIANLIDT